ncbi:hypothetical protein C8R43DRAFT_1148037 [Mycena crocata]|nr:hypothetical protein C8R43DRAFT_1241126 [Mycena crocata]KAJ7123239.1 hypothetical protein C8R43DRAFT_1148037 [Mycena crocata]
MRAPGLVSPDGRIKSTKILKAAHAVLFTHGLSPPHHPYVAPIPIRLPIHYGEIIRDSSIKATSFTALAPSSDAPTFDLNTARLVFGIRCRDSHDDVLASEVYPIHPVSFWSPCLRRQVFCQLTWILFRFDLNVSSQLPRCANLRHHTPYNIRPPMNVWLSIAGRHTTLRGIRFEAQDLDSSVWVGVYASAQYLLLHSTPMLSITVVISIPATATAVVLHTV